MLVGLALLHKADTAFGDRLLRHCVTAFHSGCLLPSLNVFLSSSRNLVLNGLLSGIGFELNGCSVAHVK